MTQEYSSISLAAIEQYRTLWRTCGTRSSDYTFANLWGWAPHYGLQWRFEGSLCWIQQTAKGETKHWAPIGDWAAVENWNDFAEIAGGNTFIRVPERLALLWQEKLGERITLEEARGQWDYLYSAEELATLSGNRFHKKKNLLKQFQKMYEYTYNSLSENCVETVLNMQNEWCRWRDCEGSETLLAENDAVARVLTHWQTIPGLCGGIIRVEGTPVAYTLAEPCGPDTLVIHFEKAAPTVKGAYQAINYLFAQDQGKDFTLINREQDLDEEGLRQAKLSYNPVDFVKKYTVTIR